MAIRDCLALSFALDFGLKDGNPDNSPTRIGELRSKAKPYNSPPTKETYQAADELAQKCLNFLEEIICYSGASAVVAVPPRPNKPFDLPSYLAQRIATHWRRENSCDHIKTIRPRPEMKNVDISQKLKNLENTIEIDPNAFKNKIILLVDDLYQSGVTMNYTAMKLLEAGAQKVFGLACEKTCTNDDNV